MSKRRVVSCCVLAEILAVLVQQHRLEERFGGHTIEADIRCFEMCAFDVGEEDDDELFFAENPYPHVLFHPWRRL